MPSAFASGGFDLFCFKNGSELRTLLCNKRLRKENEAPAAAWVDERLPITDLPSRLFPGVLTGPDPLCSWFNEPSSALTRRCLALSSVKCSCLAFEKASRASSFIASSSATSASSSGKAYLFLTASSASFFALSTFFAIRKCLRTRKECVYGSELYCSDSVCKASIRGTSTEV